jgi:hypothetical protein
VFTATGETGQKRAGGLNSILRVTRQPDDCVLNTFRPQIGSIGVRCGGLRSSIQSVAHGIRNVTDRMTISTGNSLEVIGCSRFAVRSGARRPPPLSQPTARRARATSTRNRLATRFRLLRGTLFRPCNCRHPQEFYWADVLLCECQVLVFYFSFEITAACLNLCDGSGLDLEIDSF